MNAYLRSVFLRSVVAICSFRVHSSHVRVPWRGGVLRRVHGIPGSEEAVSLQRGWCLTRVNCSRSVHAFKSCSRQSRAVSIVQPARVDLTDSPHRTPHAVGERWLRPGIHLLRASSGLDLRARWRDGNGRQQLAFLNAPAYTYRHLFIGGPSLSQRPNGSRQVAATDRTQPARSQLVIADATELPRQTDAWPFRILGRGSRQAP